MKFVASDIIKSDGVYRGKFVFARGNWETFELHEPRDRSCGSTYMVEQLPIDFHCHGVGRFDFSEIANLDLDEIQRLLQVEGVYSVLTIYLKREDFPVFLSAAKEFVRAKREGKYRNIVGFALEGPLLVSPGGTPMTTIWGPTRKEWEALAALGPEALSYVVLSPDIEQDASCSDFLGSGELPPTIDWIVELLSEAGIRAALGHFRKQDPEGSARAVRSLLNLARRKNIELVSDHLLNDMPRRIRHAWRTKEERLSRASEVLALDLPSWTISNLAERLGPVPGALIEGCLEGTMVPCLNFDGEHVDIAISIRLLELLGPSRIIGMTDRIESQRLGGRELSRVDGNSLLYQDQGVVAAGTRSIRQQVSLMMEAGVSAYDAWSVFCFVPGRILGFEKLDSGAPPPFGLFIQPRTENRPMQIGC